MFKENIMKKIAGLSVAAFILMPSVAHAADATVTSGVCKATDMAQLKQCMSKEGDYSNVTGIELEGPTTTTTTTPEGGGSPTTTTTVGAFVISENVTVTDYAITLKSGTPKLEVASGKTLTLRGNATIKGDVNVDRGTLNINTTTKSNETDKAAIKGNLTLNSANATISADNTNNNASSKENTAKAIIGDVTLTKSTLTITKGEVEADDITVSGVSTLNAKDVKGDVTVTGDGASTISATKINGTVEVNGDRNVTLTADEITGKVTSDNEKANVKFAGDGVEVQAKKGIVRRTNVVSANVSNVEVYVGGVSNVALGKNEVLVVNTLGELGENFKVTGPNGAKIDNKSGTELTITVNGAAVTVSADAKGDDAYVIAGASETPEQPGDSTNTGDGDVTVPNNPATGDSIMSYVTLALTSVASLGLAIKKFLF